ncbi:LOW QUALITY PROTEIN: cadherin-16 [Mixophyes fleayi]|uniref:LOW QUALITY PROTEIN: cadherin-16 n=1 Tax=Mixophyes fleayi TaxID=3061075 RepID=UPI003F4DDA1D
MKHLCLIVVLSATVQVTMSSAYVEKIRVPENYRGTFPFCLRKIELGTDGPYNAELAGNHQGMFELDPKSGFLCALKAFDREKKDSYSVTVMQENKTVTVYIEVMDDNDNMPVLERSTLHGIVSRGIRPGVSFMHIQATDTDDPATENADLRYKIEDPEKNLFQIDPRTGAVSLTEQGVTYLSESEESHFKLAVQVKDLGDNPMGYVASGNLEIFVAENTWVVPSPVSIPENQRGTYPRIISNVLWNSTEVQYRLSGNFEGDLFTIDENGNIYLTEELDRERQTEYQMTVSALNNENLLYADPLQMTVTVVDENDNGPVFSLGTYNVQITEAAETGSLLIVLKAEDADDPQTQNAQIIYNIISQDQLFHIGKDSGHLTLMKPAIAKRYILQVSATDLAGSQGGLSSTCTVIIDVKDINDNPPIFVKNQFPPLAVVEDTLPGAVITTLTATDEDEEPENKLIQFSVESGNEDQTFSINIDQEQNTVTIILGKDLDYEQVQEYNLTFVVRNVAELSGADYGPSSTASIHIVVGDVNEAPIFAQKKYEVQVPENIQKGSIILTAEASDPDIYHPSNLRYSIRNDSRKWLSVQEDSGKIQLLHSPDREQHGEPYTVQLVAQEISDDGFSATAEVVIHVLDLNDNIPNLVGDYANVYFCTPRREGQTIVIQAHDRDSPGNGAPFRFNLPDDVARQKLWRVTALNGTHAYITMERGLEPQIHQVPIIITDNGTRPQSKRVHFKVLVCHCGTTGHCKIDVGKMEGMPTVTAALGITLGTLGVIGFFLIIIFTRLSLAAPSKKTETPDTIPLRSTA